MRAEIQQLEGALAEVAAIRQRVDGIADQLRTTISLLQVEARLEELHRAAVERAERDAQREEDQARARRAKSEQFARGMLSTVVEAASTYLGAQTKQPEQPERPEQREQAKQPEQPKQKQPDAKGARP